MLHSNKSTQSRSALSPAAKVLMTDSVVLSECFVRDGLQHEAAFVPTERKIALIERFVALGFPRIEATSFTHPGNVPQFTDAAEVLRAIPRKPGIRYKATCVNLRSVDRALAANQAGHGPDEVSVILVPSDVMSQRAVGRELHGRVTRSGLGRRREERAT
jgi:hydroxymethylglutaryl-CoA lyase